MGRALRYVKPEPATAQPVHRYSRSYLFHWRAVMVGAYHCSSALYLLLYALGIFH
jgi:hypothetical protein